MKTFKVTVDGQAYTVQVEEVSPGGSLQVAQPATEVKQAAPAKNPAPAAAKSEMPVTEPAAEKKAPPAQPESGSAEGTAVKSPMPGSIIDLKVKEGDTVESGDVLLVLEAMKMENELTASQAGTVSRVLVKKGDTVNSGDPLVIIS